MVSLLTFLKAYKLALSNISDQVNNWKTIFLGNVSLPGDNYTPNDRITFIFSNNSYMEPGSLGISASLSIPAIESIKDDTNSILENNYFIKENEFYNNLDVNEAFKLLFIFTKLLKQISNINSEDIKHSFISSFEFDLKDNLIKFYLIINKDKVSICTDGNLFLFGDY